MVGSNTGADQAERGGRLIEYRDPSIWEFTLDRLGCVAARRPRPYDGNLWCLFDRGRCIIGLIPLHRQQVHATEYPAAGFRWLVFDEPEAWQFGEEFGQSGRELFPCHPSAQAHMDALAKGQVGAFAGARQVKALGLWPVIRVAICR